MTARQTPCSPGTLPTRRRESPRQQVVSLLPGAPDAAHDDLDTARALVDDLLALVDAGLVAPVPDMGGVRYALADDPGTAA